MPAIGRTPTAMPAAIRTLWILSTVSILEAVGGSGIGVNYGKLGNNLPPPAQVAQFLARNTVIDRVKLFDTDPATLQAFDNTDLAIDVTISNDLIPNLTNLSFAKYWIQANILPYIAATNITRILVGNEVVSAADKSLIASLVPAMQNLHTALVGASLQHKIKVSSPHSLGILAASAPPSVGRFQDGYDTAVMKPLLTFLRATGSPFMVNPYPFFGSTRDTLDYALFRLNSGVVDDNTGLTYTNMLDAQLDAIFSAMKLLGFTDVEIVVAETGWPSMGDAWEVGADMDSARDYNKNLVRHAASGIGTPLMPNRTFDTYIFSLFNENLKPGPTSERNFGLFYPNMTPVYDIGILRTEARDQQVKPMASDAKRWCVPKPDADVMSLQEKIEYVCAQGIDCNPIRPGGACYRPDTAQGHAAYVMNEYYQSFGRNSFDCDFGQTGVISTIDPSYGNCIYRS
ncbi:glucan endo-1,3-beta-glucosidase-like isoform X2 [Phoenix dactylifera]|uniref:glucan endo-1,3-beta-D-glucosidase n=1 Tax=Phoenix dactylifera TaxID=42345 RepID=A0A8B7BJN4_PHODC|nr:glucan endo-1,3-beta-glucosidase-like isoform X2 [Phoenix dactylifera]